MRQNNFFSVLPFLAAAVAVAAGLLWYTTRVPVDERTRNQAIVQGMITEIALASQIITIQRTGETGVRLVLAPQTRLYNEYAEPVSLSYFRRGFLIQASGTVQDSRTLVPDVILILSTQ